MIRTVQTLGANPAGLTAHDTYTSLGVTGPYTVPTYLPAVHTIGPRHTLWKYRVKFII